MSIHKEHFGRFFGSFQSHSSDIKHMSSRNLILVLIRISLSGILGFIEALVSV